MELITILTDYIGATLSLITTLLYAKGNYRGWILCILANFTNLYLYASTGIFAHAFLEIIYLIMAFYGLWHWLYGGPNHSRLKISNLPLMEAAILLIITIISFYLALYILSNYTTSTIATLDALAMSLCLSGQWLTARKYIESWLLWFVVDLIMINIFYQKKLPAHITLNLIYLIIAIYGYKTWQKIRACEAIK